MGLKLLNKIKVSIRALSGTKAPQSYIFLSLEKTLLLCADFTTDRSKSEHHLIRIIMNNGFRYSIIFFNFKVPYIRYI